MTAHNSGPTVMPHVTRKAVCWVLLSCCQVAGVGCLARNVSAGGFTFYYRLSGSNSVDVKYVFSVFRLHTGLELGEVIERVSRARRNSSLARRSFPPSSQPGGLDKHESRGGCLSLCRYVTTAFMRSREQRRGPALSFSKHLYLASCLVRRRYVRSYPLDHV